MSGTCVAVQSTLKLHTSLFLATLLESIISVVEAVGQIGAEIPSVP